MFSLHGICSFYVIYVNVCSLRYCRVHQSGLTESNPATILPFVIHPDEVQIPVPLYLILTSPSLPHSRQALFTLFSPAPLYLILTSPSLAYSRQSLVTSFSPSLFTLFLTSTSLPYSHGFT